MSGAFSSFSHLMQYNKKRSALNWFTGFLGEDADLNQGKGFNKHRPFDRLRPTLTVACLFATCFALILIKPWHPIVRFDSEVIRITVDPERITVDGLYRLYNPLPFPMTQLCFYPTPEGG